MRFLPLILLFGCVVPTVVVPQKAPAVHKLQPEPDQKFYFPKKAPGFTGLKLLVRSPEGERLWGPCVPCKSVLRAAESNTLGLTVGDSRSDVWVVWTAEKVTTPRWEIWREGKLKWYLEENSLTINQILNEHPKLAWRKTYPPKAPPVECQGDY